MQFQTVDRGILSVWRLRLIACVVPSALVALVPVWWLPGGWKWWVVLVVAMGASWAVWYWFWLERACRSLRFGIDATGIRIERGVWWRSVVALPRARIQHSDVTQGPLQRRYGVATLTFFTAGSLHTQVSLPGLAYGDAIAVRDSLVGMEENSGV